MDTVDALDFDNVVKTNQPAQEEVAPAPSMEQDSLPYYDKTYANTSEDMTVFSEFELRATLLEPKLTRPDIFWLIAKAYGSIDAYRADLGNMLTAFPGSIAVKWDELHMTKLRTIPKSMVAGQLATKREAKTTLTDPALFEAILNQPDAQISPVKNTYMITVNSQQAIFDPYNELFVSGRDIVRDFLSAKMNTVVQVRNPPADAIYSLRHLLSVYQMVARLQDGIVRFSFTKKTYPNVPATNPTLTGGHNILLVDDYAGQVAEVLNSIKLVTMPHAVTTEPEEAILNSIYERFTSYDKVPLLKGLDGKPVSFVPVIKEVQRRWELITESAKLKDMSAVQSFVTKNLPLTLTCEEKLRASRSYRNTHVSMDNATHRSVSVIPGAECMPDEYDTAVKSVHFIQKVTELWRNVKDFVLIGYELYVAAALLDAGKNVYIVDTTTPEKISPNIKMKIVDSLYSLTADQICRGLNIPTASGFILLKGQGDAMKKGSSMFVQNLDLYTWFFGLSWEYAVAKVFFPGKEIPQSMKPALERVAFKFLEVSRYHNLECIIIFGGPKMGPESIRGNYAYGVTRKAFWIHHSNDLRNYMIANGVSTIPRSFDGYEDIIGKGLKLYRPAQISTIDMRSVSMQFELEFDADRGQKRTSAPAPEPSPADANMNRNPSAPRIQSVVVVPQPPSSDSEEEEGLKKRPKRGSTKKDPKEGKPSRK